MAMEVADLQCKEKFFIVLHPTWNEGIIQEENCSSVDPMVMERTAAWFVLTHPSIIDMVALNSGTGVSGFRTSEKTIEIKQATKAEFGLAAFLLL